MNRAVAVGGVEGDDLRQLLIGVPLDRLLQGEPGQPNDSSSTVPCGSKRASWARFRHDATIDDIDLLLVARLLAGTPLAGRKPEELLQHFGLIQPRAGGWGVTNAALLLFARPSLVRWHPRAGLRLFRVQGTQRRHGAQRNVTQEGRVEVPLAEGIAEAHRLASLQIGKSERLRDLYFKETPEYPGFAWQEAIVNAYAHRDYEIQGLEIEVWFYSDRMEVRRLTRRTPG